MIIGIITYDMKPVMVIMIKFNSVYKL